MSSRLLPDLSSASSISYQAPCPNPSPRQESSAQESFRPSAPSLLTLRPEMVEEAESLQRPCPEKRLPILPSQPFSAGSSDEALDPQDADPVSPAQLARGEGVEQATH